MHIRFSTPQDARAIAQLLTDAIHGLTAGHYNAAQRNAWAPQSPDFETWARRLLPLHTLVAQADSSEGSALLGFISYEANGHIELLFTSPVAARRGVASRLYAQAEATLATAGVKRLSVEASLMARPFFEGRGFVGDETQEVERRGVMLRRFAMSRILA